MLRALIISTAILVTACTSGTKQQPVAAAKPLPTSIEEAVASASPFRSVENLPRDVYRHPAETLNFFGLKPEMTVVEIMPGNGWYMEILAPLLTARGQYIAAQSPPENEYIQRANQRSDEWIASHPELKVQRTTFAPPIDVAPEASADMILTFRNVHNWMSRNKAQDAFNAFFRALKPGGVLGVVEHRANPKAKKDEQAKSGYVREADVIAMATAAGFKLDAKSEINANPKDTKNYPEGVWTLPPVLRLGEKDKAKYMAIGESDRMTLRFVKPAMAKATP